jgi:hypothetical protein
MRMEFHHVDCCLRIRRAGSDTAYSDLLIHIPGGVRNLIAGMWGGAIRGAVEVGNLLTA